MYKLCQNVQKMDSEGLVEGNLVRYDQGQLCILIWQILDLEKEA